SGPAPAGWPIIAARSIRDRGHEGYGSAPPTPTRRSGSGGAARARQRRPGAPLRASPRGTGPHDDRGGICMSMATGATRGMAGERVITKAEERRVIIASSVGTVFEWYDFYLYAILAPFFAGLFFPPGNQTAA